MNIFRMIKCGILVSAAAVTAAVCCSCGSKNNYNSKVHINEAIRHMNNKYGVQFTYDSDNTKEGSSGIFGKTDSYVNIIVSCKDLPGVPIIVYSSDGSEYLDDFVPKKFELQAQWDLNSLTKKVFDGDKPTVRLSLNTEYEMKERTLPADTTYEQFKLSGALGWVDIYTDDSDAPLDDYRTLTDALAYSEFNCEPSVWYFTDDSYTRIDENNTALGFDEPEKKLGEIRVVNDNCLLDEDFDGEIMIYRDDCDPVYLTLIPADDEDLEYYNSLFLPRSSEDALTTSDNSGGKDKKSEKNWFSGE
ncbi:hypothetical protein [Ruminococcus albus]|uniref:Lipoprotein n=1 Tax=Ruminococcus albus TaxID=1264 RepID=A0A1I1REU4_RUMAL|nr:hypothetical protein [Ruminococcus albus]SFD28920.1 hypothetical protein SAMN02910406_03588 [Ruminococcus albus]